MKLNEQILPSNTGVQITPERFEAAWYPFQGLITLAFGVSGSRVVGLPDWTRTARYDVRATAPKPVTRSEMLVILQTLLMQRFSLKAHRETREMDVYALVLANTNGALGPGLRRVSVDCDTKKLAADSGPGLFPPDARPACEAMTRSTVMGAGPRLQTVKYAALTTERLATGLANLGRPVIDKTGLSGTFDVELKYVADMPPVPGIAPATGPPPDGVSLRDAIKEQLGWSCDRSAGQSSSSSSIRWRDRRRTDRWRIA